MLSLRVVNGRVIWAGPGTALKADGLLKRLEFDSTIPPPNRQQGRALQLRIEIESPSGAKPVQFFIKGNPMSGKGSKPRPISVSQQEYDTRWDAIFCRDLQKFDEAVFKNEYQDVLSTEECLDQGPQMLFENKN